MSCAYYGRDCLIFRHILWIFFDIFSCVGYLSPVYPQFCVINFRYLQELR